MFIFYMLGTEFYIIIISSFLYCSNILNMYHSDIHLIMSLFLPPTKKSSSNSHSLPFSLSLSLPHSRPPPFPPSSLSPFPSPSSPSPPILPTAYSGTKTALSLLAAHLVRGGG